MTQFNKDELDGIICLSSSDYEILFKACNYISELESQLKKANNKIKKIKKELGAYDEISSLEKIIEMIIGE